MSDFDDNDLIVRLGCYKVGPGEQVFRERALVAGDNLFRFRWLIAHKNADQNQPAIADLYVPDKDDKFVISFDPALAGPLTIRPYRDSTLSTSGKIPRVKLEKFVAGTRYALTLGPPPEGARPQGWPTTSVTIGVDGAGDLPATMNEFIKALNAKDTQTGLPRPWQAFPVSDGGFEFRLRDPAQFPGAHLSPLLDEMPVANASNPADVIAVIAGDDLFKPDNRISPPQQRSIGEFLDGCKNVDGSAIIARAAERLQELLASDPSFTGISVASFSKAFVPELYSKFAREISLEDLLRDSRHEKAAQFSRWFDRHIEDCAAELQIRGWDDANTRKPFKRSLARASRAVIREMDEAIQGKNAVALAMAMGSFTPYQTASGDSDHASLPELCGMEVEFDATPFLDSSLRRNRYKTTTVTIDWTHNGQSQKFGLYRPDGNLDCFNGATVPTVDPPQPELVEDGVFVAQPDKSDKRPVFKSTSGDGLISVRIINTSPQSYWPAFFVYLSDDKSPPALAAALASKWFSRLSVVDPALQPTEIPLPSARQREMVPIHWQTVVPLGDWTPIGKSPSVKPKYVWLFARSVAGGWLPPIPVKRNTTSSFGLKLPPSLSGLDSNQIPLLSAGTPEAPRLKKISQDLPPQIVVRTENGRHYLDVVVNAVLATTDGPGYYEKYGIDELHMLVFRRPGDLPKDAVQSRRCASTTRASDVQDDFAYYQATGWYNTLLVSGWFPLPDVGVCSKPDPTVPELTISYPAPVLGGWKYIAVIIAKRPKDLCYQVPRTAQESGTVADNSYFPVVGYVPDGVLLKLDTLQAWRYLAAGYDAGSVVPPQRDLAIRFEYSQAAMTTETYLPSPETDDVVTLISM